MIETKSHDYAWSKSWIEFKAPNNQGVYWLRSKEGKVLFVGKGKVRERLLSHWNRQNSTDAAIWEHSPATFRFELTNHPARREAELIEELKPLVQPTKHSRRNASLAGGLAEGQADLVITYRAYNTNLFSACCPVKWDAWDFWDGIPSLHKSLIMSMLQNLRASKFENKGNSVSILNIG